MALFGIGYKKKIEELKKQLDAQNYEQAALIADEITIKHLKSAHELNLVGRAYKCNGDFMQAREAFEQSYEMRCSRPVLIDIMDCCLEIKDLENAERYFDEYHKISPDDKITQYKYRYRIEKKKDREHHLLITILEELKALDYIEEYAYELAKQYHKAGMAQECMKECDEIILWFGFGPTVERAKALLAYYKGEIKLEDIKSGSKKTQEEYPAAQEPKIMPQEPLQEQPARAESEYAEETIEELAAENIEEPVKNPVEEPAEESIKETVLTLENYEEPEALLPSDDFVLPEIDMSGIYFDEEPINESASLPEETSWAEEASEEVQEEVPEERKKEDSEYFILAEEWKEPISEKLAELLKKNQISILGILKNFGRMERIQKQAVKCLEAAIEDRENFYFVIGGALQTGKTTLACYFIHLLYRLELVKYDRTAILDAVQLNQVSIEDYAEELKNCNLIIEHATEMTRESIEGLLRFSQNNKGKTCVILEDTVYNINKFLCIDKELSGLFHNRIYLSKRYSTEELFGFVYDYIKKEDYSIDKTSAQVLYDKIDEVVSNYDDEQRLTYTLKFAAEVVARAEKRVSEQVLAMAAEGKIQQGNYFVITSEDIIA